MKLLGLRQGLTAPPAIPHQGQGHAGHPVLGWAGGALPPPGGGPSRPGLTGDAGQRPSLAPNIDSRAYNGNGLCTLLTS
jgi:hypothetical protein